MNNGGQSMVFERAPGPALRPFVRRFMVVEFPTEKNDSHLPSVSPIAAFTFRGRCRVDGGQWVPRAAFTGLRDTARHHEHGGGHSVLLVVFTPAGAAALIRPPLEEFSGLTADLAEALGRPGSLAELHDRLEAAPNHAARVHLLEDYLTEKLRGAGPDPLASAAASWLEREGGSKRIPELARYIGLSQSALERRFRRVVGVTPKKFASLVRLQRVIRLRNQGTDFATAALEAGYFDQAHFINDFRKAAGCTPEAYFRGAAPG